MENQNPKKNPEGYTDLTPYQAIKNIDNEEYKAYKTFDTILHVARLAGFHIDEESVIILCDKFGRTFNGWELKERYRRKPEHDA